MHPPPRPTNRLSKVIKLILILRCLLRLSFCNSLDVWLQTALISCRNSLIVKNSMAPYPAADLRAPLAAKKSEKRAGSPIT